MTEQSDDQQTHERLRSEATDLLLAASSPARNIPELKPLIDEHEGLVQRRAELNALEAKLAEVLPVVEQAEADVVAAEKQVAAEKKQLASFAGKLGQAVFAGFQAGELPDQPAIGPRKELQARIDALQQQRSSLLAEEKTTFLDKTKQQAQQLALAGQIKVEEFRIPAADRALGEAILGSKEKQILKSSHTESVLKAILEQMQRVGVVKDRHKAAEEAAAQRKTECGAKLGRGPVQSLELKAELKELRSEVGRNSKRISSLRDQLVDVANKSEVATRDSTLGSKLAELTTVRESIAANRPQLVNALGAAADQLTKLPAGKRRLAILVVGSVVGIMILVLLGRGMQSNSKFENKASVLQSAGLQALESAATADLERKRDVAISRLATQEGKKASLKEEQNIRALSDKRREYLFDDKAIAKGGAFGMLAVKQSEKAKKDLQILAKQYYGGSVGDMLASDGLAMDKWGWKSFREELAGLTAEKKEEVAGRLKKAGLDIGGGENVHEAQYLNYIAIKVRDAKKSMVKANEGMSGAAGQTYANMLKPTAETQVKADVLFENKASDSQSAGLQALESAAMFEGAKLEDSGLDLKDLANKIALNEKIDTSQMSKEQKDIVVMAQEMSSLASLSREQLDSLESLYRLSSMDVKEDAKALGVSEDDYKAMVRGDKEIDPSLKMFDTPEELKQARDDEKALKDKKQELLRLKDKASQPLASPRTSKR